MRKTDRFMVMITTYSLTPTKPQPQPQPEPHSLILARRSPQLLQVREQEKRDEYVTDVIEYEGRHPLIKSHDSDCEIEPLEDHFRIKEVVAKAKYVGTDLWGTNCKSNDIVELWSNAWLFDKLME